MDSSGMKTKIKKPAIKVGHDTQQQDDGQKKVDAQELLTDEELGLGKASKSKRSKQSGQDEQQDREQTEQDHAAERPIPESIEDVKAALEELTGLHKSFDLVFREMEFGSKKTAFFYANGFAKDAVLTDIIVRLSLLKPDELLADALSSLLDKYVAHIQVDTEDRLDKAIDMVFRGATVLFIDGETSALAIDAKQFPVRSIDEPALERVVRGARDGFVETLLTNVTLIRRRIRDPHLRLELVSVGVRTKTDICIGYIEDIADPQLVESLRDKIGKVNIDGIPLGDKQLEEAIIGKGWNPYPSVRYSERPDVVSSHMLEGHVIVFADTSPSVMILPTTFFHLVQHVEEYRQAPLVGSYLRWVRFIGIFASLFLLPLWFLLVANPELKPAGLEFLGPQKEGKLPVVIQFLMVEVGVDLMRLAAVHTPAPLSVAMGLVAAILIGDIAVKTGLFINEVIMYMAIAAIGMFATPSYELGLANRLVRLVLIVLVAVFKTPGLVIGTTLWLIWLATNRSYNTPYMWPFLPFNAKAMLSILVRKPILSNKMRPSITKAQDRRRQPEKGTEQSS